MSGAHSLSLGLAGIRTSSSFSRTFLCELSVVDQPLVSRMPEPDGWLPTLGQWSAPSPDSPNTPSVRSFDSPHVGGFGRAAQATALLDQVVKALSLADLGSKRTQLDELDGLLRSFLATVMQQCQGTWGVYCAAIAIAIR